MSDVFVVTEENYAELLIHPAHVPGLFPRTSEYGDVRLPDGRLAAVPLEERVPLIPRERWPEWIARKDAERSWLEDKVARAGATIARVPTMDQGGLGYCWVYAPTKCLMIARVLTGQPLCVLSPESVGGPVTGWVNRGGWPEDALKRLITHGACEMSFMDRPNSLSPSRWRPGWQEDCKNHQVDEFLDCDVPGKRLEAAITCCLVDFPASVGYDWWRHEVVGPIRVMQTGTHAQSGYGGSQTTGRFRYRIWNQWGEGRTEFVDLDVDSSRGQPSYSTFAVSVPTEKPTR